MINPEQFANIMSRWNNLSPAQQAVIQALPDVQTATQVINKKIQNDPDTGRAAFAGIGDVSVGAIVGAVLGSLGLVTAGYSRWCNCGRSDWK